MTCLLAQYFLFIIFSYNIPTISTFKTKTKTRENDLTILDVLNNEPIKKKFSEFLKKEFSIENLIFYDKIEFLRNERDKDAFREEALKIYRSFIDKKGVYQLNLSAKIQNGIQEKINKGDFENDIFDDAQRSVLNMMKNDSFHRFISEF